MATECLVYWKIGENYKDLIQKEKYEFVLLDIMNESKIVFPKAYNHIEYQSNGESDFVTTDGKEYLDAKVLFYQEQCRAIKQHRINDFFNEIQFETNQLFQFLMENDLEQLEKSRLFIEISKRLGELKGNEDLILFFPFDITGEQSGSLTALLGSDVFSQLIIRMKRLYPDKVVIRNIYFIYLNMENMVVLKKYSEKGIKVEFLKGDFLKNYIECLTCDVEASN